MPVARASDGLPPGEFLSTFSRVDSCRPLAGTIALIAALACSSCGRPAPQARNDERRQPLAVPPSSSAKNESRKKLYREEGNAVWYLVPENSRAKRGGGKDELTAAHNRLPLGTLVRVTHLANGQSVIVRITDRGISKRGATIDLCREAAEKLNMTGEGVARVLLEELPDDKAVTAVPDSNSTAAQP